MEKKLKTTGMPPSVENASLRPDPGPAIGAGTGGAGGGLLCRARPPRSRAAVVLTGCGLGSGELGGSALVI